MNYSIGYLLDYRDECFKKLKKSVEYMDIPCVFYYIRLLEIVNVLILNKGYK